MDNKHQQLLKSFKTWLIKDAIYSDFTITDYLRVIKNFFNFLYACEIDNLRNVDNDVLSTFLKNKEGRSYSIPQKNKRLAALGLFFNWAYEKRFCSHDPIITFKRSNLKNRPLLKEEDNPSFSPTILTPKEQTLIHNAVISNNFISIRNKCIACLLLASGLFVEEVIHLPADALQINKGYIDVNGEESRQRTIYFDTSLCLKVCLSWLRIREQLLKEKKNDQALLFISQSCSPLSKRMLQKCVSNFLSILPLKHDRLSCETLRQTAICNWLRAGHTLEYVQKNSGIKTLAMLEKYRVLL